MVTRARLARARAKAEARQRARLERARAKPRTSGRGREPVPIEDQELVRRARAAYEAALAHATTTRPPTTTADRGPRPLQTVGD